MVESDAALQDARTTITDLKTQLEKTSHALAEVQARLNDPALNDTVAKLEAENKKLNVASAEVQASIANRIAWGWSSVAIPHSTQLSTRLPLSLKTRYS